MRVLPLMPHFWALPIPWELLRAEIAQLVSLNSHQSSLQLQGSTLGSEQKPCTAQIFALQLEKQGEKELWTACTSLWACKALQTPA